MAKLGRGGANGAVAPGATIQRAAKWAFKNFFVSKNQTSGNFFHFAHFRNFVFFPFAVLREEGVKTDAKWHFWSSKNIALLLIYISNMKHADHPVSSTETMSPARYNEFFDERVMTDVNT